MLRTADSGHCRGDRAVRRTAFLAAVLATLTCGLRAMPAEAQERQRELPDPSAYPGLESLDLSYDNIRIQGTTFILEGDVDLLYEDNDVRVLADELRFDAVELTFAATGNVSFEQGELLLNGTSMSGDLDAGTMVMENAIGVAPGPVYVRAERIEQLEPGKFHFDKGVITPCNQTTPIWEFRSGSGTFKPESYVAMAWPHVRVKGVPILGLPYVYWPLQDTQRQTGFLLPSIGRSNRKGFMVSESFFWASSRSTDLTLTYEHFSNAGHGFSGEFRHALAESSSGFLRGFYLPGRQLTPEEEAAGGISFVSGFAVTGAHVQGLPGGFVLRSQANFISSIDFVRGFQDEVDQFLQRQSMLAGDISKSWGASTLTIVGDHRENFLTNRTSFIGRRLPHVKYQLRSTQLAGPIYVALQSSAARFQKFQVNTTPTGTEKSQGGSYQRLDAFPELSVQLTQIPWLTFQPFFRWRSTWWSAHESRNNEFRYQDEPVFRNFYETGVEFVGPSFFRIFETPGSDYSPRVKHLIQPRVIYRRIRQLESDFLDRILQFDEVDGRVVDRQELVAEVTTRLFAKRFLNRQDDQRQVWQVFEFTVGRSMDLDPLDNEKLEAAGAPRVQLPYFARTVVQPTAAVSLRGSVDFTPTFKPANVSFTADLRPTWGAFTLSWFRGVRTGLDPDDPRLVLVSTTSHSARANTELRLFGGGLTLAGGAQMDLFKTKLQAVNAAVQWNLQCCSIGLDIRRFNFAGRQETQFGLLLDLAHVGQVGLDNRR